MKILFIEPYPTEGPSSRYRVEQYIPYLRDNGIRCAVRPFVSSKFYRVLYKKGFYARKVLFFIHASIKRFLDIFTAATSDIVFIHLEAYPLGPPVFEWILWKLGKKIIYDLDDAIYMGATSPFNKALRSLKFPSKVEKIIRYSRYVIACNEYLADYARQFNKNITVIHTSVDTDKFKPLAKKGNQNIVIGWIGSHSTAPYLEQLRDVFCRLGVKYGFVLKIIGATTYNINVPSDVSLVKEEWRLKEEIEQFQSLDIGIYPLPADEWTLGKTGFKTIQYMSVGIPCVVSDVGTNKQIIQDGINGYLAKTTMEWVEKLSQLIEDESLRKRIGIAGRKTAEERFSLKVNAPRYLKIISDTANNNDA